MRITSQYTVSTLCVHQRLKFRFIYSNMIQADSLDDAGWNVDILHWDDFSKLLQTIHIFDLTAELGAIENRKYKDFHQ